MNDKFDFWPEIIGLSSMLMIIVVKSVWFTIFITALVVFYNFQKARHEK